MVYAHGGAGHGRRLRCFKVKGTDGPETHFVDANGAPKYSSISDFLTNNQLSTDGTLATLSNGNAPTLDSNGLVQVSVDLGRTTRTSGRDNLATGWSIPRLWSAGQPLLDVAGGIVEGASFGLATPPRGGHGKSAGDANRNVDPDWELGRRPGSVHDLISAAAAARSVPCSIFGPGRRALRLS